jgi:hypothetical protein
MKITEQGLLSRLYQGWKNKKLKGAAKKLLDKNPDLRKAFQDINKANQNAIDILDKRYKEKPYRK